MYIKKTISKISAVLTAAAIFSALIPYSFAADYATRKETADMLLKAADDYNPSVKRTDIIKGYEDGLLHEEDGVSRVQALVMLERAFGSLPEPVGHNKRVALQAESFTDIPDWAQSELKTVFDSGIAAGVGNNKFSPDDAVTKEQLKLFISRVYALYGTNLKDDFYASVNKQTLENLKIPSGMAIAGGLNSASSKTQAEIAEMITGLDPNDCPKGTKEQKIVDLCFNITDIEARDAAGIEPIQKYIDLINNADSTDKLISAQGVMQKELYSSPYMAFFPIQDAKNSDSYILDFEITSTSMEKDFYKDPQNPKKALYIAFISDMLKLMGDTDTENKARKFYDYEAKLAAASLNAEDRYDIDKTYNIFTIEQINEMFAGADIEEVFKQSKLNREDKVVITDLSAVKEFGRLFADENLGELKTLAKIFLAMTVGQTLHTDIYITSNKFIAEYTGAEETLSDEDLIYMTAVDIVEKLLGEEVGRFYSEKKFSKAAKDDVKEMVSEIIAVYSDRIDKLEWMSLPTRTKAKSKLKSIKMKIGYPDEWDETPYDGSVFDIKSKSRGGSYFDNYLAVKEAEYEYMLSLQNTKVEKKSWVMAPYEVNACYSATSNDITFPAAILQSPMYDINASREENLGGIGYIIAHEITHAFDNSGAKFDENGNVGDWWREEDYRRFQELCNEVAKFYDGEEGIPGIGTNGKRTLSENVADMGAAACITEVASRMDKPNYKVMYEQAAKMWAVTKTRKMAEFMKNSDTHSDEKLRINRVFQTVDKFYDVYGISEGDGMYVPPEERKKIW